MSGIGVPRWFSGTGSVGFGFAVVCWTWYRLGSFVSLWSVGSPTDHNETKLVAGVGFAVA